MHSTYDNMHKNALFDVLICINNNLIVKLNCMILGVSDFWVEIATIDEQLSEGVHGKFSLCVDSSF